MTHHTPAHPEHAIPLDRHRPATEAALAQIVSDPDAPPDLLGDALHLAATAATASGERLEDWLVRSERRYGPGLLDRAGWPPLHDDVSDDRGQRLRAAGVIGMGSAIDPLSADARTDIPSLPPAIPVAVCAGIEGVRVPLRTADGWPVVSADLDIAVLLDAQRRGAHMSRLQELVGNQGRIVHQDPVSFARVLAEGAASGQTCNGARVTVRAVQQPPITSGVTGRASSLDVATEVTVEHAADASVYTSLSVTAQVMTSCPCTVTFSRLKSERVAGRQYGPEMPPTFTHSQPGELTVKIETGGPAPVRPEALLETMQSCAILREAVLKRPDEHDLVERSHRRPQFTEDLVRETAVAVAAILPGETEVTTRASLSESIHPHRAAAALSARADELWMVRPGAH